MFPGSAWLSIQPRADITLAISSCSNPISPVQSMYSASRIRYSGVASTVP